MTRVLVLGNGPLLQAGVRTVGAHCLRTWHITKTLVDAGHDVLLYAIPIFSDRLEEQQHAGVVERTFGGFSYRAFLNANDGPNLAELERAAASFRPEALLGANTGPAALLARLSWRAPMWADLYGSGAIEAVAKARAYGTNAHLGHAWEAEAAVLRRADKFSTVSQRQLYALHGELMAAGRLNRHTFDYRFGATIPAAFNPEYLLPPPTGTIALRGERLPADAFVALWSGAYNAWADGEGLLRALESAMERCPALHYVSTGGAVHGHDDLTYARFQAGVRASRFRERFHLLGWIDATEVPAVMAQADLGLCVDTDNHESTFGARTRTINMMAAGVPILTTTAAEISEELARAGVVLGCPCGDARALAERLAWAVEHRAEVRAMGARGRDHVVARYGCDATTPELRAWIAAPAFAPDNAAKLRRAKPGENPFEIATNPIEERASRRRAAEIAVAANPNPYRRAGSAPLRAVQSAIGEERYEKLRALKEAWLAHRPAGESALPDELRFAFRAGDGAIDAAEFERLAATLPALRRLTIVGDFPTHPQAREIAATLAVATAAPRFAIVAGPFDTAPLESFACGLLEDADLAGTLEVVVEVAAYGAAFDALHEDPRAWLRLRHTLFVLARIARDNPGRFEFRARMALDDRNFRDIEKFEAELREHFGCGAEFSARPGTIGRESADEILAAMRRLDPKRRRPDHAALRVALDARRADKPIDSPAAGRTGGVVFASGDVAACELAKPFGNLKDFGFDFHRAWTSPAANAMRQGAGANRCTHGCWLVHEAEARRA